MVNAEMRASGDLRGLAPYLIALELSPLLLFFPLSSSAATKPVE
jgi:hypothetical protein